VKFLASKLGPLPVWGWLGLAVGGVGYIWYRNKQASAANTSQSTNNADALGFGTTPTSMSVQPSSTSPTYQGLNGTDLASILGALFPNGIGSASSITPTTTGYTTTPLPLEPTTPTPTSPSSTSITSPSTPGPTTALQPTAIPYPTSAAGVTAPTADLLSTNWTTNPAYAQAVNQAALAGMSGAPTPIPAFQPIGGALVPGTPGVASGPVTGSNPTGTILGAMPGFYTGPGGPGWTTWTTGPGGGSLPVQNNGVPT
jgi:hypothetical protein